MTLDERLKRLREAYDLGQTYWQQADSDYYKQHKLAKATQEKFKELCETDRQETKKLLDTIEKPS